MQAKVQGTIQYQKLVIEEIRDKEKKEVGDV